MNKTKKDFPIFKNNKNLVYVDNAATTQKPQIVIDSLTEFYEKKNASAHRGMYPLSVMATAELDQARTKVAKFIGAQSEEIIFTKNATEGFNMIAIALEKELGRWENIVVTEMEHHSNFLPWQQLCKRTKAKFIVAKFDKNKFELEDVVSKVDLRTKIVAITGMSNVTGQILDLENIIFNIKQKNPNTIVVVDATQLVAHKKIDVKKLDADFIIFSAHKMYGPTGVGVVWGNFDLLTKTRPFLYGGNMVQKVSEKEVIFEITANKFEAGTIDVPGIVAFGVAIDYLKENKVEQLFEYEEGLKEYALSQLRNLDHVKIIGHTDDEYGPVISIHVMDVHPHDLAEICGRENVCIRAGHHCAQPLMTALDLVATARISLSFYNDKKDVDAFIKAIKKARKIING